MIRFTEDVTRSTQPSGKRNMSSPFFLKYPCLKGSNSRSYLRMSKPGRVPGGASLWFDGSLQAPQLSRLRQPLAALSSLGLGLGLGF